MFNEIGRSKPYKSVNNTIDTAAGLLKSDAKMGVSLRALNNLNNKVMNNPTATGKNSASLAAATNALNEANAQAASYQSQLDTLNANVAEAKQNNWIQYMKAAKALPQLLANSGSNGGKSETSSVRLLTSLGSANNDVDKEVLADKTNLEAQVKAANATAAAARKRLANAGSGEYVTNAYGNILNNAQQSELDNIIRGMEGLGYTKEQIYAAAQKAGF